MKTLWLLIVLTFVSATASATSTTLGNPNAGIVLGLFGVGCGVLGIVKGRRLP